MSTHHAADDEPQATEMSWIQGLAKPIDSGSTQELPFHRARVPQARRHISISKGSVHRVPSAADTSPMRRISAEQVDHVINRLDSLPAGPPAVTPDRQSPDLGSALIVARDAAVDAAPVGGGHPATCPALTERPVADTRPAGTADPAPGADADADEADESRARRVGSPIPQQLSRSRLRKPALVGAAAVLCLLTIGGGTMSAMDKTVFIVVDGKTQQVTTLSNSVAGALSAAGIYLTDRDALAPGVDALISDGSTIVLDRGQVARASAAAVSPLGLIGTDRASAANRSRAIPLQTITSRTVRLGVAGRVASSMTTSATTVGELLREQQVILGPGDSVSPVASTKLVDRLLVIVRTVVITHPAAIAVLPAPAAITMDDPTMIKGTSKVVRAGRTGREKLFYQVTTVNGKQTAKIITARQTLVTPVGQITNIGTRSGFTYSGSEVYTNDTSFGVNWDGLAMCESTHNPRAINANPSAGLPTYGMFQFDLPTWASVGGSGNPIDASPEEQLMRAKLLYQSRGLEPWACRDSAR